MYVHFRTSSWHYVIFQQQNIPNHELSDVELVDDECIPFSHRYVSVNKLLGPEIFSK